MSANKNENNNQVEMFFNFIYLRPVSDAFLFFRNAFLLLDWGLKLLESIKTLKDQLFIEDKRQQLLAILYAINFFALVWECIDLAKSNLLSFIRLFGVLKNFTPKIPILPGFAAFSALLSFFIFINNQIGAYYAKTNRLRKSLISVGNDLGNTVIMGSAFAIGIIINFVAVPALPLFVPILTVAAGVLAAFSVVPGIIKFSILLHVAKQKQNPLYLAIDRLKKAAVLLNRTGKNKKKIDTLILSAFALYRDFLSNKTKNIADIERFLELRVLFDLVNKNYKEKYPAESGESDVVSIYAKFFPKSETIATETSAVHNKKDPYEKALLARKEDLKSHTTETKHDNELKRDALEILWQRHENNKNNQATDLKLTPDEKDPLAQIAKHCLSKQAAKVADRKRFLGLFIFIFVSLGFCLGASVAGILAMPFLMGVFALFAIATILMSAFVLFLEWKKRFATAQARDPFRDMEFLDANISPKDKLTKDKILLLKNGDDYTAMWKAEKGRIYQKKLQKTKLSKNLHNELQARENKPSSLTTDLKAKILPGIQSEFKINQSLMANSKKTTAIELVAFLSALACVISFLAFLLGFSLVGIAILAIAFLVLFLGVTASLSVFAVQRKLSGVEEIKNNPETAKTSNKAETTERPETQNKVETPEKAETHVSIFDTWKAGLSGNDKTHLKAMNEKEPLVPATAA